MDDHPDLALLRARLEEEERAYASLLAALDSLAALPLPAERVPEMPQKLARLNELWTAPTPPPEGGGLPGLARRNRWKPFAPAFQRQSEFNGTLVQILNRYLEETAALHARLAEVVSVLVQYLQHVLPVVDARDRVATALATTRAELVLESFDRRQESLGRRLEGLLALRDRVESLSEEVRAVRSALAADAPAPVVAAAAARAAEDARYVAFENRFRGEPAVLRERLAGYVPLFEGLAPVVDLGCGRGEFLELLRERGLAARGVEGNAQAVAACRAKGLDIADADLVDFLREQEARSLGGVFASQVVEHLPPAVLLEALAEAHRVLRPGGLLVLETVNTRSVVGFLEVYLRDLTHRTPLHPETLAFLAAAQGFTEVRVEMRSPVDPSAQLQPVPAEGLPPRAAAVIEENTARLNALLYGPQEYVLIARR